MPDRGDRSLFRTSPNRGRCCCGCFDAANFRFAPWAVFLSMLLMVQRSTSTSEQPPTGRTVTTVSQESITRLAFGSCNKQYLPQPMWKTVEELSPDVWLWIGDAVYVEKFSDGGVEKMKEAFNQQMANEDYQRFLGKVPRVEGVWDDHDYGVNDAGKELSDHQGRVSAFLDFLGVGTEDPRRGGDTLYSSHEFGEAPKKVKVILLDIRTQRDGYHAFNIAHRKFKFAAMIGAFLRWFSSSFCLGSDYPGAVIGDDQWEWLEGQLEDSDASVHVLVSTLQVLTSNALVESWGHFPHSRKRLLDLLHRTNPAGLVILSGDVHHAELASGWRASPPPPPTNEAGAEPGGAADLPPGHPPTGGAGEGGGGRCPFARSGGDAGSGSGSGSGSECLAHSGTGGGVGGEGRGVVEVTTSGMTHSCLATHGKTLCEAYLNRWRQHRWRDDAFFLDKNFGDIEIEWAEDDNADQPARMAVTVRDGSGVPILPIVEHFGGGETEEEEEKMRGGGGGGSGTTPTLLRRRRRAAGYSPASKTAAAANTATPSGDGGEGTAGGEQEEGRRGRRGSSSSSSRRERPREAGRGLLSGAERTFLDRSPPSECVEDVLHSGCTARRTFAAGVCVLALVVSCVGLSRGVRSISAGRGERRRAFQGKADGGQRNGSDLGAASAEEVVETNGGAGSGSGKGARSRNGRRNGS